MFTNHCFGHEKPVRFTLARTKKLQDSGSPPKSSNSSSGTVRARKPIYANPELKVSVVLFYHGKISNHF